MFEFLDKIDNDVSVLGICSFFFVVFIIVATDKRLRSAEERFEVRYENLQGTLEKENSYMKHNLKEEIAELKNSVSSHFMYYIFNFLTILLLNIGETTRARI